MKQHETAEDLVCQIEYLYHQSRYLNPAYRRLLCNALIQPHFDYGCSSWFPLLKKYLKFKLQKASNFRYIRFCLNSLARSRIDPLHLRKISWLPVIAKWKTVLRMSFLSTGMELYQDMYS